MLRLKARLALELPHINSALNQAALRLPAPARPAAEHTLNAGGKRLRPFLTVLFARLLGYQEKDIYSLAITLEMLHAATLMHDDVLDNADTRRGKPAAHTIYGTAPSILAGDALLATANQMVAEHHSLPLAICFADAIAQTSAGAIEEMDVMRRLDQDEAVYHRVILGKTAWLIRSACLMGAMKAGAEKEQQEAAAIYGENLGIAFQMVDDALDFAPESLTGKPSGGDLREGKLTPPIRLYRNSLSPEARQLFDKAFTDGLFSAEDAKRIGEEIRLQGFDAQTRSEAGNCLNKAAQALDTFPDGSEKALLLNMISYVQQREK